MEHLDMLRPVTTILEGADSDASALPIASTDVPAVILSVVGSDTSTNGNDATKASNAKKRSWKKPADKPRRPLSAYNLFFQLERTKIITESEDRPVTAEDVANISGLHQHKKPKRRHRKTHGKISFADLARTIADKWKKLTKDQRAIFEERAEIEKARYKRELDEWTEKQREITDRTLLRKVSLEPASGISSHMTTAFAPHRKAYHTLSPNIYQPHLEVGSLRALVAQGNALAQQRLIEQTQMDIDTRQATIENMSMMHLMRNQYNRGTSSYVQQANPYTDWRSIGFDESENGDYYEMAERSYAMARMTLPRPPPRMKPRMDMTMATAVADNMAAAAYRVARMNQSFRNHDTSDYYLPADHPDSAGVSAHVRHGSGDILTLDPHQGLSSPTFDDHNEESSMASF
jgi:HMG (high mobility group) box